ncbi:MAG: divergent PAP2 family protein [Merismopedia sp. SIO2A8]|nr:divergent PAP2 family protein [Symploca sp. SIO2B6]NET50835.1 divergent PAP2 family protein [Merismopedia sp. SIO2A8]
MPDLLNVLGNSVLIGALVACFSAQLLKFLIGVVIDGKVHPRTLFETGGMPSSHSAFVTAMAAGVGATMGWDSPDFAIAVVVATIVMYDASGVRQEAGKHAKVLNRVMDEVFTGEAEWTDTRLKELLGHTSAQVVAGAAWGVAIFGMTKLVA